MKSYYVARCWRGDAVLWEAWSYDKRTLINKMRAEEATTDNVIYYVSQKTCKHTVAAKTLLKTLENAQTAAVRAECERVKETQEETDE